jgi:hypothetical protein
MLAGAGVLIGALSFSAIAAEPAAPKSEAPKAASAKAPPKVEIARTREAWRKSMQRLPQPKEGCYAAEFPRVEWKPVTCVEPPDYPMPPARGKAKHFIVGGGGANDFAAEPTASGPGGNGTSTVQSSDGTFVSLSAGITEQGQINAAGGQVNDAYTLQLNTNTFTSTACAGTGNPTGCRGWEQFVYENNNTQHRAFIQYWLIQYNAACPAGWMQFTFPPPSTDIYCFRNSPGAVALTAGQPVSNLNNVTLTGAVTATSDRITVFVGATAFTTAGSNAVNAAAGWTDAEFNVFGDAGGGQANFGANTTMVGRTMVHNGTRNAPTCVAESFTGETNNLTLVGMNAIGIQPSPSIEFTQSNIAGTMAACVTAAGIGDTHLSTFGGLLYDFQASGDFVLAQIDKDFVVQARQISGAPTWPNASVNKAVAAQMGESRVAFCTAPPRLVVDGNAAEVVDGQVLSLPTGVDILRRGNVYVVQDQRGNGLRAELNATYINVTVGLGRWPTKVSGILANAGSQINKIQARTGTVLTAPFPYATLYHEYADSWRVSEKESLLSVCGDGAIETGIPTRPFYAKDLDPQLYKRARDVCRAAGVRDKSFLEACTLDVAVIGDEKAAQVFVGLRAPAAVGRVVGRNQGR